MGKDGEVIRSSVKVYAYYRDGEKTTKFSAGTWKLYGDNSAKWKRNIGTFVASVRAGKRVTKTMGEEMKECEERDQERMFVLSLCRAGAGFQRILDRATKRHGKNGTIRVLDGFSMKEIFESKLKPGCDNLSNF